MKEYHEIYSLKLYNDIFEWTEGYVTAPSQLS
jgi:hypothetical protein